MANPRAKRRLRREEAELASDPLFDAEFYSRRYLSDGASGFSPARHYLLVGRFLGFNPHPLFDASWYSQAYADVGAARSDPLLHYIRHGRAEGRRPNAFFDPAWYRRRNPDAVAEGWDPLQHFLERGAAEGRDPSARFRIAPYLARNPGVASAGANPLAHYLSRADRDRSISDAYTVDHDDAVPVTTAAIECRKQPTPRPEAALFVTHSKDGGLKPHVAHYLRCLAEEGVAVTLVVAADSGFSDDAPWLYGLLDGLYVRENQGWDFAAWAHVMRLNPHFFRANTLFWLNDSVIGPVTQNAFHLLLKRVRANPAALIGLTANSERREHIQSYFLAFKSPALESDALRDFVFAVKAFQDKDDVINSYEIHLSEFLENFGLKTDFLFKSANRENPTLYHWERLLEDGFPFIKVLVTKNSDDGIDPANWRAVLKRYGYDQPYLKGVSSSVPPP